MAYLKIFIILLISYTIAYSLDIEKTTLNNQVTLAWSPNSEADLSHYNIYRDIQSGTMVYLSSISRIDTIFTDTTVQPGVTYYYKVTAVDYFNNESGPSNEVSTTIVTTIDNPSELTPAQYFLEQNYPNPFNPSTKIRFHISSDEHVKIEIFDISGQFILTLLDAHKTAGVHEIEFRATDLPSGVYMYSIEAGKYHEIRQMILIK